MRRVMCQRATMPDVCRPSWFKERVAGYLSDLAAQHYKKTTLHTYERSLLQFGEFVERQHVHDVNLLAAWIAPFIEHIKSTGHGPNVWRSMLRRFLLHLQREGLMEPPAVASPAFPHQVIVDKYVSFQRDHRGVCVEYAKNTRRCCAAFTRYLAERGVANLGAIRPDAIQGFITSLGGRYHRKTMCQFCSVLRGFLRYLYRQGITCKDLSPLVTGPRLFRQEECPRFLTRSEAQEVLSAVDRQTPQGRRDYAMLCLLLVYGLRGIEVIRLQLDDIDWRNEELRVRSRKAGNNTIYPLSSSAGNAILAYLRNGRPTSTDRQVFLSTKPPFPPLAYTCALGCLTRKYMAQAGVRVERPGTHTFRYSCAQRLLDEGTPLKSIGDYLGHRSLESTQRYTKIDVEHLRAVATGDGEDLL
ncbi:MAG TPA: tyrosine-type recombinase/integrase [Phycisphaerae bacterium]|nr:tyrosine-type recombinase/integrase [Phycisphaerae bacterium]